MAVRNVDRGSKSKRLIHGLALGGLLVSAVILLVIELPRPWPKIVEGCLDTSGLVLIATYEPLRRLLVSLSLPQRWFLAGLTAVMLVTQLWSQPQRTFPFIPWEMYSSQRPDPTWYHEYVGITDNGREVVIPAARVFRAQHRTVPWRLKTAWKAMESTNDETRRAQIAEEYDLLLTAMVKRFNEKEPGIEVRRVRLVECTIPRPVPGRTVEVRRRQVAEFAIE